ncbi:MAG: hypothetical protein ACLU7D_02280 [Collinsella sp.]
MGIMVAGTTAKNFTASMNRRMPAGKVLNDGSTMVAAQCGMLLALLLHAVHHQSSAAPRSFRCSIAPAWARGLLPPPTIAAIRCRVGSIKFAASYVAI